MKKRGLFINNAKAQDSIYESGLMVFNCLRSSDKCQLDYIEVSQQNRSIPLGYDFYFFNYHPSTMSWIDTSRLRKIGGCVMTMVLEVLPGDPFVLCPDKHFDGYCVLDPTMRLKNPRVFPFPRPLETTGKIPAYEDRGIPVIGSFGFATRGKGFQHVVDAVNKEFDRAIIRINIPFGDFVKESEAYSRFLEKVCMERAKEGIEVRVTHDYMSKEELIAWCSQNTLNCFFYDRRMPGLAATTDQAIVSGRPLAVSENETFRHILAYFPSYPQWSLRRSIEGSAARVKQIQVDWAPANFTRRFEEMLDTLSVKAGGDKPSVGHFELPLFHNTLRQKVLRRYRKYKRILTYHKLKQLITSGIRPKNEELI